MIVKLSILGMLVVLVAVLVISMRFRESFADAPMPPKPRSEVAAMAPAAPAALPSQATLQVGDKAQAGVFIPSQPSDTKASTLIPHSLGAAGPAPVSSMSSQGPMASQGPMSPQGPMASMGMTPTGMEASTIKNQSDLLANIQKVIHNELLANRATDTSVRAGPSAPSSSPALTQGREHQKAAPASAASSASGSAHAAGCSGEPCTCDQSDYIKKDSIPCWGCALDY